VPEKKTGAESAKIQLLANRATGRKINGAGGKRAMGDETHRWGEGAVCYAFRERGGGGEKKKKKKKVVVALEGGSENRDGWCGGKRIPGGAQKGAGHVLRWGGEL